MNLQIIPLDSGPATGWTCPHCNYGVAMLEENHLRQDVPIDLPHVTGSPEVVVMAAVCPRPQCHGLSLQTWVKHDRSTDSRRVRWELSDFQAIRPKSTARVFPVEAKIPAAIVEDYEEGCLILQSSPKAAATLFRRALQGMIRDFWGVAGQPNLYKEILAIQDQVEPEIRQALLDLKDIGNIGAHMEKDVNLILDIAPEDAAHLRVMIELLITDWYIGRYQRRATLDGIADIKERLVGKRDAEAGEGDGSEGVGQQD